MNKDSIEYVLERLKAVLDAPSDSALSRALDITPQTISSWKIRGSIPYSKCIDVAREENVSLDWLLTGQGAMHRGKGQENAQIPELTPRETALLTLFNELSENDQREIQSAAEEKKRLNELEKRLARLEEEHGTGGKKMA